MSEANKEQAEYWGVSASGQKWITHQEAMDAVLQPVLDLVLDRASPGAGDRVLDIGCGTGASLIALAERVGPAGSVLGADISPPFVDLARSRVAQMGLGHVEVHLADAQTEPFPPSGRDMMISRFGVMFFADPPAAFANIGKAVKPGGTLTFAAWADVADNPWFRDPARIAKARMGPIPPADPFAPGPMAFADRDRVLGLLRAAGLQEVTVDTVDIDLTPSGGLAGASALAATVGPAVRILDHHNGTREDASAVEAELFEVFAKYDGPDGMRVPARIHLFQAKAAGAV